jgi:Protein of unknown function (DUF1583)
MWTTLLARLAAMLLSGLGAVPSASAAEIGQDFRGKPYDPRLFLPTGPGFATAIRSDRQGLRIVLPPEHGMKPPVGIVFRTGLKGDFEITMEFEVVDVKGPKEGRGAGPSLYLTMVSPTQEAATTGWKLLPDGDMVFYSHHASTPIGGKREHYVSSTPAKGRSGRLRFVRTGSTLAYLAAEGNSDPFREIDQFDIGKDDVNGVRVAADNGGSPTLVDVRIKSVKVVADELGDPTPLPPPSSRWPLWLAAVAAVAAGGAYGAWRSRR